MNYLEILVSLHYKSLSNGYNYIIDSHTTLYRERSNEFVMDWLNNQMIISKMVVNYYKSPEKLSSAELRWIKVFIKALDTYTNEDDPDLKIGWKSNLDFYTISMKYNLAYLE